MAALQAAVEAAQGQLDARAQQLADTAQVQSRIEALEREKRAMQVCKRRTQNIGEVAAALAYSYTHFRATHDVRCDILNGDSNIAALCRELWRRPPATRSSSDRS